jgi:hypothetical protein
MARLKDRSANIGLRDYLIEYAEEVLLPVMGVEPVFVDMVERLKSGGEYSFNRYELPDGHPAQQEGSLHDYLILGSDDSLRVE